MRVRVSFLAGLVPVILGVLCVEAAAVPKGEPVSVEGNLSPASGVLGAAAVGVGVDHASYSFDDSLGNPVSQGWTPEDGTVETDLHFHVDDFGGAPGFAPLAGTKSLWCGVTAAQAPSYVLAPGYGNDWVQVFQSTAFGVVGDVTLSCIARWDTEQDYDLVTVDYRAGGGWQNLALLSGSDQQVLDLLVPAAAHGGSVEFRFAFHSDGSWSDEDGALGTLGAVVIDSLRVSDVNGLVDLQDFESETVGALGTSDGDWNATFPTPFGDRSALVDGTGVLQQGFVTNNTNFWSFFGGSSEPYRCGIDPQIAVAKAPTGVSTLPSDYIDNRVVSPLIDLTHDSGGAPSAVGPEITLRFDSYYDLALDDVVYLQVRHRFQVGGSMTEWEGTLYYFPPKDWVQPSFTYDIPPGADAVQVSLGVVDRCWTSCPQVGSGSCHSHGPLVDNVHVFQPDPGSASSAIWVTTAAPGGPGSLAAAIDQANASAGPDTVCFGIPGTGPHIIQLGTDLPVITEQLLIDGFTQSGSLPNGNGPGSPSNAVLGVGVDGLSTHALFVAQANGCVIQGVAVMNSGSAGIWIQADSVTVRGCHVGMDPTGLVAAPNLGDGILVPGGGQPGSYNVIGGTDPADRNIISGNTGDGLDIGPSVFENTVVGNFIGTDATGAAAAPNQENGIRLSDVQTAIGGSTPAERNVISGNGWNGIRLSGQQSTAIRGNHIGTDVTGLSAVPNGRSGIEVSLATLGSGAGMPASTDGPAEANLIAYNTWDGIRAVDLSAGAYSVGPNSIHSNGLLGVDLGGDGPTANVPNDGLQDHPHGVSVTVDGDSTTISGMIAAREGDTVRMTWFANAACDASGYGEGETYLGSYQFYIPNSSFRAASAPPSPEVEAPFTATFPVVVPGGQHVSGYAISFRQTSEFSPCVQVINTPAGTGVPVEPPAGDGSTPVSLTFDDVLTEGNTYLTVDAVGPGVPGAFQAAGDYYHLSTDAVYTGDIEVCIEYDDGALPVPEGDLLMLHWDENLVPADWVDITSSRDTVNNVLCGITDHFSPFLLAVPGEATAVPEREPGITRLRSLPNPFRASTTIRFHTTGEGRVVLTVFDLAGRVVRRLVDGNAPAGEMQVRWDGRDDAGRVVPAGVYSYRIVQGGFRATRKIVRLP